MRTRETEEIRTLLQKETKSYGRISNFEKLQKKCRPDPGGITDNSPAFQRWVQWLPTSSPDGTPDSARGKGCLLERHTCGVSRPFGTWLSGLRNPTLKRWAIVTNPSGMLFSLFGKLRSVRLLRGANFRFVRIVRFC